MDVGSQEVCGTPEHLWGWSEESCVKENEEGTQPASKTCDFTVA